MSGLGVGAVALGLAIGSGELILWPHLVSKFGLGILWGAALGIFMEYFINQEIARNALATGESFFTSSARVARGLVFFWLAAAILLYVWPGWAGAMGATLAALFGWGSITFWAWASLGLVLVLVLSGRVAYRAMERVVHAIVVLFFLLLIAASFANLTPEILQEALRGLLNFGWLPSDIHEATFLGAVVFAGAGGLLSTCISLWYRDKKAGMGSYVAHIENPLTGEPEAVATTGYIFEPHADHLKRWKAWMTLVRVDQGVLFAFMGLAGLLLLSLNAYAVLSPLGIAPEGIDIIREEARVFGGLWGPAGSMAFLGIVFLELFSTLWVVLDVFTRIVGDLVYTNAQAGPFQTYFAWAKRFSAHQIYYALFVLLVVIHAALVPFGQPFFFLVTSAVLGGGVMAVYIPILLYLNNTTLPKAIRPSLFTNGVLIGATCFYAYFSFRVAMGFLS